MKYFDKDNKLTLMHKELNKIIRKTDMLETSKKIIYKSLFRIKKSN